VGRISRAEAWEVLGGHSGFFAKWEDWPPEKRKQVWDQLGTAQQRAIWALFADNPHCLPEPVPVEDTQVAPVAEDQGMAPLVENEGDMPEGMVKESRAVKIARNHGVERASDLLAEELVRGEIPALQKSGTFWLKLEDLDSWIQEQLAEVEAELDEEPEPEVSEEELQELEQQLLTETAPVGRGGFELQVAFYVLVTIVSLWVLGWVFLNGV
jgi:hypothetical protein